MIHRTEITPLEAEALRARIEAELTKNILPFWQKNTPDPVNGGFYGELSNVLEIRNETPRSAILISRILWTYARAYHPNARPEYLEMARKAFEYLKGPLWDGIYGGVFWSVDARGKPVVSRKHSYAQAFAIYGLSEYFIASKDRESLALAEELFSLLEQHAHDRANLGYIESRSRDWSPMEDMRLSEKDLNCAKSMNTLLHLTEAYANLMRVLPQRRLLYLRLEELLQVFLGHVIDPKTYHLRLFFDDNWNSLEEGVSYGHDIEASWLLGEAAGILGDGEMKKKTEAAAVLMAQRVYDEGLDKDGSIFYEVIDGKPANHEKHWWVQAEGMVGFYNAYQLTGQLMYGREAQHLWGIIEEKFVDREHGDWFKVLDPDGRPILSQPKVGPWECPYHHSRACFEMLDRLSGGKTNGHAG